MVGQPTGRHCHPRGTALAWLKKYKILKVRQPRSSFKMKLVSFFLSSPGISSCTLSTWLTCRLASSEQQRMFLEREHSLHHSHEMTEKVGQDGEKLGQQHEPSGPTVVGKCIEVFKAFVCAPSNRRSWTTPVTAFLRSPTTDTQHHHDDVSPGATCTR